MENIILKILRLNEIGEPPWDYNFLANLPESEYPKYLAKIFNYRTGEKLPLRFDFKQQAWVIDKKRCKTFNQKIQWIKLYGITDLMRKCTDKVAVRDYVRERIGEEYLKPVLQIIPNDKSTPHPNPLPLGEGTNSEIQGFNQKMKADKLGGYPLPTGEGWGEGSAFAKNDVSTYFDQINWNKLPNAFVIKCNHGCKWHCIVKDKQKFISTKQIFKKTKNKMAGWLEQEFWLWEGFELNYRKIKKQLLIEPYMNFCRYIEIYCFNGIPKIYIDIQLNSEIKICIYDKNFSYSDLVLKKEDKKYMCKLSVDETLILAVKLSQKLANSFQFVRVDWAIFNNNRNKHNIYFEELTFTPYSGFSVLDEVWNNKLGDMVVM